MLGDGEDGTVEEIGQNEHLHGAFYAASVISRNWSSNTSTTKSTTLAVRIGNAGESQAPAAVAVSFYDGDP